MVLRLIAPSKILAPYIKSYWYLNTDSEKEVLQTIVPNGLMGLCFYRSGALNYIGLGKYQSGLGGQRLKSLLISSCGVEAVGVEFFPYGVRRFFPIPAKEFYEGVYSPQDISDNGLIKLENDILSAKDVNCCWELFNRFFLSRLEDVEADALNFKRIVASLEAVKVLTNNSVEVMAEAANLSQKQFRRIFSDYVGSFLKVLCACKGIKR